MDVNLIIKLNQSVIQDICDIFMLTNFKELWRKKRDGLIFAGLRELFRNGVLLRRILFDITETVMVTETYRILL